MKNQEVYKADRRPYVEMMVERHQVAKFDRKSLMIGFVVGLLPYITHQWPAWF